MIVRNIPEASSVPNRLDHECRGTDMPKCGHCREARKLMHHARTIRRHRPNSHLFFMACRVVRAVPDRCSLCEMGSTMAPKHAPTSVGRCAIAAKHYASALSGDLDRECRPTIDIERLETIIRRAS